MVKKEKVSEKELAAEPKAKAETDAVINAMPDAFMVIDLDGRIVSINPVYTKMFGWKSEEMVRKSFDAFKEYVKPEDMEVMLKIMGEVIETGTTGKHVETVVLTKDGREVPISVTHSLIKDAEGNLKNLVTSIRDITEFKWAEEEQAKAEAARATAEIIEGMPDPLFVVDLEGVILFTNPAYTKMFGWKSEEIVGKSFDTCTEAIRAGDIKKFMNLLGKLVETGYVEPVKTVLRAKDGREIPTSVTYSLIKGADGNPKNIIVSLRDITELKKTEEELRIAEERYRTTFESTGTAMAVLEEDTTISLVNKEFARLSGYSKKEIEGKKSWTEFTAPEEREKLKKYYYERRKGIGKVPMSYEFKAVVKDGGVKDIYVIAAMLPKTKMSVISMIDITELKHLQEKEKDAVALAERAAIIDTMVDGVMVHDLDGNIISSNKALDDITGCKLEENVGKSLFEFLKPGDSEIATAALAELLEKGKVGPMELTLPIKDGREIPIQLISSLMRDAQGNPIYGVVVIRDITELKKAEGERAKAAVVRERASILDIMDDGLLVINFDGAIISFNTAMKNYFMEWGIDAKKSIGKPIFDLPLIRPEDMEKYMGLMKEVVETGNTGSFESIRISEKWVSITVSLLKGEAGNNPSVLFAVIRDITELKHTEEDMETKLKELEEFNDLAVGRELKMVELKKDIRELKKKLEVKGKGENYGKELTTRAR